MAYKVKVKPKSSADSGSHHEENGKDGDASTISQVHQTSPGCMLTFVRWATQTRTINKKSNPNNRQTLKPLVVTEDIVQVQVQQSKASFTPTANIVLRSNTTNYLKSVQLGDFVIINMLDHDMNLDRLIDNAKNLRPINDFHSGFKGLFRVNSVTKELQIVPNTGLKRVVYNITAHGFSEFNNKIYFNPNKFNTSPASNDTTSIPAYAQRMNIKLDQLTQGGTTVENAVSAMIESIVGTGVKAADLSPNRQFVVPPEVGNLMGINNAKQIQDIYAYVFGVQKYATSNQTAEPYVGLNPSNLKIKSIKSTTGRIIYTNKRCEGVALITPQYWNQTPGWSIIQSYANLDINEIFVSYRTDANGSILPTVVFRQIPFSSNEYNQAPYTRFLELPRWEIAPELVTGYKIGKDDALRVNFVQMYGFPPQGASNQRVNLGDQDRMGNSVEDRDDILRFGLRPNIRNNAFDEPRFVGPTASLQQLAPKWAKLLGDMQIGQHQKLGGTLVCMGIEEPIAVGDNLQFDDIVFHIETVAHMFEQNSQVGFRKFQTHIALSNGVADAKDNTLQYAEQEFDQVIDELNDDFKNANIKPGINGESAESRIQDSLDTKISSLVGDTLDKALKKGRIV